ncbi:MAG: bifunctional DNA primase/polymerase, partial [Anaerolineae bacterium]|nr:bifunctional DNA primase/polymerase [Anaerolineae bacterium]
MRILETALQYATRGWHVLPLKPKNKHPLTPHGVKDATTDPETIR